MTEPVLDYVADLKSFDNGVQTYWDATSLDSAQRCMRYYYFSIIRGLTPKVQSVHLIFGGIYAKALEQFYKLRAEGAEIEDALRSVIRLALTKSWDSENGHPVAFEDAAKTRPALIRTIVWYIEEFVIEQGEEIISTYHLQDGRPAVELSFQLEFTENIVYCGHLDRVVHYGDDLYVMDQKTTGGALGTWYFNSFKPSNQMSGYAFAGKAILHSPISGVIIDAAQIQVQGTQFARGFTSRSQEELDEWYEGAVVSISHAQHMTEAGHFPMNPNSCGNYGGCPFRQLCSVPPRVRENFIKSDFRSRVWDPVVER